MDLFDILSGTADVIVSDLPSVRTSVFVPGGMERLDALRARFSSVASRSVPYAVPLIERCFELAEINGRIALLSGNGWLRRGYGEALRRNVLSVWQITDMLDVGGAFIEGHGEPCVVLAARKALRSSDPRVIACQRAERSVPLPGEPGIVWREQVAKIGLPQANDIGRLHGPMDNLTARRGLFEPLSPASVAACLALAFRQRDLIGPGTTTDAMHQIADITGITIELPVDDTVQVLSSRWSFGFKPDTDHLGWLLVNTDAEVRESHGARSTPAFVRDALLELSLTPALDEPKHGDDLPLVLDPACGVGDLLVDAFGQLARAAVARGRSYEDAATLALTRVSGASTSETCAALTKLRLLLAWYDFAPRSPTAATLRARAESIAVGHGDALLEGSRVYSRGDEQAHDIFSPLLDAVYGGRTAPPLLFQPDPRDPAALKAHVSAVFERAMQVLHESGLGTERAVPYFAELEYLRASVNEWLTENEEPEPGSNEPPRPFCEHYNELLDDAYRTLGVTAAQVRNTAPIPFFRVEARAEVSR